MPNTHRKKSVAGPALLLLALLGASGGGAWYIMNGGEIPLTGLIPAELTGKRAPDTPREAAVQTAPAVRTGTSSAPQTAEQPTPPAVRKDEAGAEKETEAPAESVEYSAAAAAMPEPAAAPETAPAYQASGTLPPELLSRQENPTDKTQSVPRAKKEPSGYHPDNIVQPPAGVQELRLVTEAPRDDVESLTASSEALRPSGTADTLPVYRTDFSALPERPADMPSASLRMDDTTASTLTADTADSVVTPRFLTGLARWMTKNYQPAADGGKGQLTMPLTSANAAFGQSLEGLRHITATPEGARAFVLYHTWSPGMLEALCRMYEDQFIQAMHLAAAEREELDDARRAELFRLYADQFRRTGTSFAGLNALPDLDAKLAGLQSAERAKKAARQELSLLVSQCEDASRAGRQDEADRLRGEMLKLSRRINDIQDSINARQSALINEIHSHVRAATLNDGSLLYLARWLGRRNHREAAGVAARMLDRMALRFDSEAQSY